MLMSLMSFGLVFQTISAQNNTLEIDPQVEISHDLNCDTAEIDCDELVSKLEDVSTGLKLINNNIVQNTLSNYLLYSVSAVLAGIAIAVAIVTTRTAVKQERHYDVERKHRLRPIIVRREYFDFRDGLKRPHKIQENKILFRIENKGPLAAVNIVIKWYVAILENKKRTHIRSSEEDYPDGRPLPELGPEESYSIDLFIDNIHYEHALNNNDCIFGIILDYEDTNKNKHQYRLDGYFDDRGDLML